MKVNVNVNEFLGDSRWELGDRGIPYILSSISYLPGGVRIRS